jgi:hypothetical protein
MKNKKRGQAATEFMTTYGWVIVVVLVSIGSLAYFGVLNPEKLFPEKCVVTKGSGISCDDYTITGDAVILRLKNEFPEPIKIMRIVVDPGEGACNEWTSVSGVEVLENTKKNFQIICPGLRSGSRFKGNIEVEFEKYDQTVKVTTGRIEATVGGDEPGVGINCVIDPSSATNPMNTEHQMTITVMEDGIPISDQINVDLDISGVNSITETLQTELGTGQVVYSYTGSVSGEGIDNIMASGVYKEQPFACTAMKMWVEPVSCTIEPTTASNVAGTSHEVTATVRTWENAVVSGALLDWSISGVNAGIEEYAFTDPSGSTTFSYPSNGQPGTDIITATGYYLDYSFYCSAEKEWTDPEPQSYTCTIDPANDINQAGTEHTIIGTITMSGTPPGPGQVDVILNIDGVNPLGNQAATLPLSSGEFEFSYTSNGLIGEDTITVNGEAFGTEFMCGALKTWVNPTFRCTVDPAYEVNYGTSTGHIVIITVTDLSGAPKVGEEIEVEVMGTHYQVVPPTPLTTDGNGQATFSYSPIYDPPGMDMIYVRGFSTPDDKLYECYGIKVWEEP